MTSYYYLNVYDTSGDLQFVVTDFNVIRYARVVNAPGLLEVTLRGDHPLVQAVENNWQIEVWRKPDGGSFARDFVGLMKQQEYSYGDQSRAVLTCPGLMSMLSWRIVAWHAGVSDRSVFSAAAETIMKTLAGYNAGSNATTANGRLRNGAISGLSVEADGAGGNSLDWVCPYENLLDTLQRLASIAGGDFDLVKTAVDAWQIRWYTGQLGSDRTASVIFALERGNMGNPSYQSKRIDERTVCIVGGPGEDADRETAIVTGDDYSAANDRETFVNATDCDTSGLLETQGAAALKETRAQQEFSFDVIQTPAMVYGVHYTLGDLVTAVNPFTALSVVLKVEQVTITAAESGAETIDVKMAMA